MFIRVNTVRFPWHMTTGFGRPMPQESWGDPLLLSQAEVAYRLSISRTSLWRLVQQGELDTVSIGSRTFIVAESVNDFLRRNRTTRAAQ